MMIRLRVVLPPDWALGMFMVLFVLVEGPFFYVEWKLQQPLGVHRPGLLLLRFAAIGYGVWRVAAFHPAHRPEYRAWLERTPWTHRKPLPAGPAGLSWEDALPLGALALLSSLLSPSGPYVTIGLFLVGSIVALAASSWSTGTGAFGYAQAFGVGLAVRLWPDPRAFLAAAVATYAVGWVGLRVALAKFPWAAFQGGWATPKVVNNQEHTCGWPFDQLQPRIGEGPKLGRVDGFLIGLLVGWYLFAAEALLTNPNDRLVLVQVTFSNAIFFLAGLRTVIYCGGYSPPISVWGRLRNFRWIIPGYDQVFLAPLCILLIGVLAFDRFRPPGMDDLVFFPAALAVAVIVALTTGPSLTRWRLTGRHRISTSLAKKGGDFVKVG